MVNNLLGQIWNKEKSERDMDVSDANARPLAISYAHRTGKEVSR